MDQQVEPTDNNQSQALVTPDPAVQPAAISEPTSHTSTVYPKCSVHACGAYTEEASGICIACQITMELRVCMPEGRGDDVLPNNETGYNTALAMLRQLKEKANVK